MMENPFEKVFLQCAAVTLTNTGSTVVGDAAEGQKPAREAAGQPRPVTRVVGGRGTIVRFDSATGRGWLKPVAPSTTPIGSGGGGRLPARCSGRVTFSAAACAAGYSPSAGDECRWDEQDDSAELTGSAGASVGGRVSVGGAAEILVASSVRPVLLSASAGNRLCTLCRDGDWDEAMAVLRSLPSAARFCRRGLQPLHYLLLSRRNWVRIHA